MRSSTAIVLSIVLILNSVISIASVPEEDRQNLLLNRMKDDQEGYRHRALKKKTKYSKKNSKKKSKSSKKGTRRPTAEPTTPPTPEPNCQNQADNFFLPKESCSCRGQIETVYFVGDVVCGPQYLIDAVSTTSTAPERLSFEFTKTLNVDSIELRYKTCSEKIKVTTNFLGLEPGTKKFGGALNATIEYTTAPVVSIEGECITALDVEVECSLEVAALNICVPPTDRRVVMVPDSTTKRVILFDEFDGLLLDKCFIDGNDDGFNRPVNAIPVNDEIWISDQNADSIFRYTQDGVFIGILDEVTHEITGLQKTNGLDNIRGIEFVGDKLYVATNGNASPQVVVFKDGKYDGFFLTKKVQDVLAYQDELYLTINENNEDAIDVYTIDGAKSVFIRTIAQSDGVESFDFLQQLTVRQSSGTLLAGGFSAPSGIYNFALDGTILNIFREIGPPVRAAYELGNGNVLWSSGDGSVVLDVSVDCCEETEEYSIITDLDFRPSVQYITPIKLSPSTDSLFFCDDARCIEEAVVFKCPRTCDQCLL